jgi:error-prone DNA polymerase
MQRVEQKLRLALRANDISDEVATKILTAITSFALYGFPESHAISFALITYASSWLKVHRPAEFYVGLLNNQPMGFYTPATLIKDAQRQGIKVRSASVIDSEWLCAVESDVSLRLGFCLTHGLNQVHVEQMITARQQSPFQNISDFRERTSFDRDELRILAKAGALNSLIGHRRDALWAIENALYQGELFSNIPKESASPLAPMQPVERLAADFSTMRLTTGPHPMAYLRRSLPNDIWRSADLALGENGTRLRIAGLAICRQRPGTAKGFVFISLEDETGISNAIVTPQIFEENRLVITQETFLLIEGILQLHSGVIHVRAEQIHRLPAPELEIADSHDFH